MVVLRARKHKAPRFRALQVGKHHAFKHPPSLLMSCKEQHRYCRSPFQFSSVSPPAGMKIGFKLSIEPLQSHCSPHTLSVPLMCMLTHTQKHTYATVSLRMHHMKKYNKITEALLPDLLVHISYWGVGIVWPRVCGWISEILPRRTAFWFI